MTRRPGFLVYGLLAAFVLGSTLPLYWSFVLGSLTTELAIQGVPPPLPGGHFSPTPAGAFTIHFWSALAKLGAHLGRLGDLRRLLRHPGRLLVGQASGSAGEQPRPWASS